MTRPHSFWMAVLVPLLLGATEYEQAVAKLQPGVIGGGCPGVGLATPEQAEERDRYYSTFGWPILTDEAADKVARFIGSNGAVDFGAGAGYFSYLLDRRGVDVVAFDDFSWGTPPRMWHPVGYGSFETLQGTQDRTLVLSWPTRETGMATKALQAWGGTRLVYAGEILRGAAEPSFFKELSENWRLVEHVFIPQWHNRADAVWMFERDTGNGPGWDWMVNTMKDCQP